MQRMPFLLMVCLCFTNIKGMDAKAEAEEIAQAPKMACDLKAAFPALPDEIIGTLATTRCLQKALRKNVTAYLLSNPDLAETDMENLRRKINPDDFEKILKRNKVLEKRYFIAENSEALIPAVAHRIHMQKLRNAFVERQEVRRWDANKVYVMCQDDVVETWGVKQTNRVPISYSNQLWSDGIVRLTLAETNKRRLQELNLTQLKFIADLYRQQSIVCSAKDAETFNSIEERSIKERLELNYPSLKEAVDRHNQRKEDTKRARVANTTFNKATWTFLGVCAGAAAVGGLWWWMSGGNSASKQYAKV